MHRPATGLFLALIGIGVAPAAAQWKGKGEVGLVYARGNSETETANLRIDAARELPRWKHAFGVAALRSATRDEKTAQRAGASWQSDGKLTGRAYWFGGLRYERDEFSGFDYQASGSTGFGYQFLDTERTRFSGQAGVGYARRELAPTGEMESDAILRGDLKLDHGLTATTRVLNTLVVEAGAEQGRGLDQGIEVRGLEFVDRRGHGHDDDVGLGQHLGIGGVDGVGGLRHLRVVQLARGVGAAQAGVDLVLRDVEADGAHVLAEFDDEGQADIAQTDDRNGVHAG